MSEADTGAMAPKTGEPSRMAYVRDHISIARPDHWFKNVFMLPGIGLAAILSPGLDWGQAAVAVVLAVIATCLIASANYTINEWLDAETDRFHPLKKNRPSLQGRITATSAWVQWTVLAVVGLSIGFFQGFQFGIICAFFLLMGLIYNVKPVRSKDRVYADVISESINNPIRFLLGWSALVTTVLPPVSILIAYWMGGAFLMAVKRYAEYRYIGSAETAGAYRRSFKFYDEQKLLLSSFFYAIAASFFLGVFLIKYRIEFIISMPFFALLFVWYMKIGMRADSVTQRPEKLYSERKFIAYVVGLSVLVMVLFFVDMPWLNVLVEHKVLSGQ